MNSEFTINTTASFDKSIKKLFKKYNSLGQDLSRLRAMLQSDPLSGIPLGHSCYKIRLNITAKKAGKRGGARVITYVRIENKRITLLDIYDKSEKENISEKELTELLKLTTH